MFSDNVKTAYESLKRAKWRSFFTMLGIIVGVLAVLTTISLGQGLKNQVNSQVGSLGSDLITIRPGQDLTRDKNGKIIGVNLLATLGGTLSDQDVQIVSETPGIKSTAPLAIIPLVAESDNQQLTNVPVVATSADYPDLLQHKLAFGGFFGSDEDTKNVAILGRSVAQSLFSENVPIGQTFRLRGQNFLVRGVFDDFSPNPLMPTTDFNTAIFIPYGAAGNLLGSPPPINQIFAKPSDSGQTGEVATNVNLNLLTAHAGQQDFTVLKQQENLAATSALLNLITNVVLIIAGISLVLGGVGIMNVMLVAVTERTREIGIRKAIGATNRQILNQFITEASVLSLFGSTIGVILAVIGLFVIRVVSSFKPAMPLWSVGIAVAVSACIGVIFGIIPALKAAQKDPIDALRYE